MAHMKAAESGFLHTLATQLDHVAWEGFRFYDLIFPLFVFIAGVSLVFSLTKTMEREGRSVAVRRVIRRGLLLWFIGVLFYGGWYNGFGGMRLLGVLQRIGLCYLFAGLLFIYLKPRGLVIAFATLLLGYWAAMSFIPMPGLDQVSFEEGKNLANWVDFKFLPGFKWDGNHDPEGLLSTLPAIGTCLLGVFAGLFLRDPQR
ncbi:MAG: heparan-alpha-glucosaminide N-acetyltransferase domain-containing protein, partial [Verrucomicrobiales bacterium]